MITKSFLGIHSNGKTPVISEDILILFHQFHENVKLPSNLADQLSRHKTVNDDDKSVASIPVVQGSENSTVERKKIRADVILLSQDHPDCVL